MFVLAYPKEFQRAVNWNSGILETILDCAPQPGTCSDLNPWHPKLGGAQLKRICKSDDVSYSVSLLVLIAILVGIVIIVTIVTIVTILLIVVVTICCSLGTPDFTRR